MNNLYDQAAENSVIGAMLLRREATAEAMDICLPEDFFNPFNGKVFATMCDLFNDGVAIDTVSVGAFFQDPEIYSKLIGFMNDVPSPSSVGQYARLVYDKSVMRNYLQRLHESDTGVKAGMDPYESAAELERFIATMGSPNGGAVESMTLSELAQRADAIAPVVIPGMMNQDYRTIVVGSEGSGKSVLLRSIGISASQGIHPLAQTFIEPVRVLQVDLENPAQGILETGNVLMNTMMRQSRDFDETRYRIYRKPGGIDIRRMSDRADLQREIAFQKPQLVIIGPIYKMYKRKSNESYEDSADDAMDVLDKLRFKYNFALVLEHHAPKGSGGRDSREMTPFGSQRWLAWPEAGIALLTKKADPTVMHIERFRGDRLAGIAWPDEIFRDPQYLVRGNWYDGLPLALTEGLS